MLIVYRISSVIYTDYTSSDKGQFIKYVTLFLANSSPPPQSLFVTHSCIPQKRTSYISDPRFLVGLEQKTQTKAPVQILSQLFAGGFVRGVLSEGLLSGRFCPGWFCPFSLLSDCYICYNRKLNITLNFMFHMKIYKRDVTCS